MDMEGRSSRLVPFRSPTLVLDLVGRCSLQRIEERLCLFQPCIRYLFSNTTLLLHAPFVTFSKP